MSEANNIQFLWLALDVMLSLRNTWHQFDTILTEPSNEAQRTEKWFTWLFPVDSSSNIIKGTLFPKHCVMINDYWVCKCGDFRRTLCSTVSGNIWSMAITSWSCHIHMAVLNSCPKKHHYFPPDKSHLFLHLPDKSYLLTHHHFPSDKSRLLTHHHSLPLSTFGGKSWYVCSIYYEANKYTYKHKHTHIYPIVQYT